MRILIVEDNKILSNNIHDYLKLKDIESKQIFIWKNVNYELTLNNYDLVILDLWLPDVDWLEVCENIRNSSNSLPILMLTARSTIEDKLAGFDSWADDYLVKPFDYEELLMRIKALTKRNFKIKNSFIELWDIYVDLKEKEVKLKWEIIHLSKLETELLIYLIHNKGITISKEELLEKVWWEYDAFSMTRTVDVYIWYLRKKLWKDLIKTVRWEWYKLI